jgi:hypothetical protein
MAIVGSCWGYVGSACCWCCFWAEKRRLSVFSRERELVLLASIRRREQGGTYRGSGALRGGCRERVSWFGWRGGGG